MTPQDDAVEDVMNLDAEMSAGESWITTFDPFKTSDGYDFATFMLHFAPVFEACTTQVDGKAFLAPGASVSFTYQ